jgi:deoxyribose-phosphate aldolase
MKYAPMTEIGQRIAGLIDQTLLRADATSGDVITLCREAVRYGFAAVCVNPRLLPVAVRELAGSPVKPSATVGFPLGAVASETKAFEAAKAVAAGAAELDMVLAIGALKEGNVTAAREDIAGVVRAAGGRTVKVILETHLLTDEEKVRACRIAADAGADFVKTSTGFTGGGATESDVRLMRQTVGDRMGVKASGGIRTAAAAEAMIRAGANRIGTSSGVAIVTGAAG